MVIQIAAIVYAAMSLVTFIAYGLDKRAAVKQKHRTPEKTLHVLASCGGWPGALVGQQVFRHKRRKKMFMAVTILVAIGHIGAWIAIGWMTWNRG